MLADRDFSRDNGVKSARTTKRPISGLLALSFGQAEICSGEFDILSAA